MVTSSQNAKIQNLESGEKCLSLLPSIDLTVDSFADSRYLSSFILRESAIYVLLYAI
jgi:hypothetical protein